MSEEQVKRKRGRPRKNPVAETNTKSSPTVEKETKSSEKISDNASNKSDSSFEYNSYSAINSIFDPLFSCGVYDYFNKEEIGCVLRNPILNHNTAIRLSEFVYTKNGIVANSIDYMTSLPCLDRIVISMNKRTSK